MTELKCNLSNPTLEPHYDMVILSLELTSFISFWMENSSHKSSYPIVNIIDIH